jgi:hypothetical protein
MDTMLKPPKTIFEVYQSLPEGTLCQLINNQLIMSPAPADIHQKILIEIAYLLIDYVKKSKTGSVRMGPSDVYLSKRNVFQPDIYFVANENTEKFGENGFHGAPDLVKIKKTLMSNTALKNTGALILRINLSWDGHCKKVNLFPCLLIMVSLNQSY